jgi:hypothetical protein
MMRRWETSRGGIGSSVLTLDDVWAERRNSNPELPRIERLRAVDLKLRQRELTILCHSPGRILGDVILGEYPRKRGRVYYRNENLECSGAGHRRPDRIIGLDGRAVLPPGAGSVADGLQDLLVATGSTPREARRTLSEVTERLGVTGLADYLGAPYTHLDMEQLWAVDVLRVMLFSPELLVVADPWPNPFVTTPRRVWLESLAAALETGTAILLMTRHSPPDELIECPGQTLRVKLTGDLIVERELAAS